MSIVTIVGSGLMGTAVAYPLSDNGHTIRLVGTHLDEEIIHSCKANGYHPRLKRMLPANVQPYYIEELEAALDGAQVIVSGVSSPGVHWIGQKLGPYLKPGQKIIAITKGLELNAQGELTILPDVLRSELPESIRDHIAYVAVGGPCIAGELAGRRHSLVVYGSRQVPVANELAALFRTPYYHISTTPQLEALELCAALKNAYTLGVGLTYGIVERTGGVDEAGAYMYNLAAGLFGTATNEIAHLLHAIGTSADFAHGLPGAGDLYDIDGRTDDASWQIAGSGTHAGRSLTDHGGRDPGGGSYHPVYG